MSNVEATQPSSSAHLKSDPARNADVVVVGKIFEDANGMQFLIPEKRWTKSPNEIYLPEAIDLNDLREGRKKKGITGEKYLLYMSIFTNGKVIELLKNSRNTIDKFAEKKYYWNSVNPSWQFCEADKECVRTKNLCQNIIGINKKYLKAYKAYLKAKKKKIDCSEEVKTKTSASKCVENFCG